MRTSPTPSDQAIVEILAKQGRHPDRSSYGREVPRDARHSRVEQAQEVVLSERKPAEIISPQDFIQLPPSGGGHATLVEELEAVARREKLPPESRAAMARVLEATNELKRRIVAREQSGSSMDPRARAADRVLDDAWGAFQSWLLGWTKVPEDYHARIAHARHIYGALFPKGLQFRTLDFKDEWTESQNRIDRIHHDRWDIVISDLGAGVPRAPW